MYWKRHDFPWLPWSPDLTYIDIVCFWRRIKYIVFQTNPMTPKDMELRIYNACQNISRADIESAIFLTHLKLRLRIDYDWKQFEHIKNNIVPNTINFFKKLYLFRIKNYFFIIFVIFYWYSVSLFKEPLLGEIFKFTISISSNFISNY